MGNLVPIGSVLTLNRDVDAAFVVIGYYPEANETSYDYLVAPYPQGMFELPFVLAVNEEAISSVKYRGYENEESREALDDIQEMMSDFAQANMEIAQAVLEYSEENPDEMPPVFADDPQGSTGSFSD